MPKTTFIRGYIIAIAAGAFMIFVMIIAASIGIAWILSYLPQDKDLPAWVQAVGAILTIITGFATIYYQRLAQANDRVELQTINARVAFLIAAQAMATLGERLDAVLAPNRDKHPYRLRGTRASEMIASLRELDTTRIPPALLEKFLQLRSNFHALNERISEIYDSEKPSSVAPRQRSERAQRLKGGLEIWSSSRAILNEIRTALANGGQSDLAELPATFDFEENRVVSGPDSYRGSAIQPESLEARKPAAAGDEG